MHPGKNPWMRPWEWKAKSGEERQERCRILPQTASDGFLKHVERWILRVLGFLWPIQPGLFTVRAQRSLWQSAPWFRICAGRRGIIIQFKFSTNICKNLTSGFESSTSTRVILSIQVQLMLYGPSINDQLYYVDWSEADWKGYRHGWWIRCSKSLARRRVPLS